MPRSSFAVAGAVVALSAVAAFAQPAESGRQSSIGFPSVAAALEVTRAKPGVNVSIQAGWTIIEDRAASALWSFTPPGHPAHPGAVRRTIVERDGTLFVDMAILCQATKSACDKLAEDFTALNAKMREDLARDRGR
jgi:hypothetical protein